MTADETADRPAIPIVDAGQEIERARAKINLALHVLDRRPDGYHTLDSVVVFAELADTLTASRRNGSGVEVGIDGGFAGALSEATRLGGNLVHAAADALTRAFPDRVPGGVRIELTKHLPIAAGIGGGSADAAATLRLLNRIWRLGLTLPQLARLGSGLGADVPVCVFSQPARMEGIGEQVTPLTTIPALPLVLVNPGVAVETRAVFRALRPAVRSTLPSLPDRPMSLMELVSWLGTTRNDLFAPASKLAPVVATALLILESAPDCLFARMSGSGATVFGIFPSIEAASRAAERLRAAKPQWWTAVTRTEGF